MPTYQEVFALVLDHVSLLPAAETPLAGAYGQVVAVDVRSRIQVPCAATAAFDGYAVRSADVASATREAPVTLRVGETVRAGSLPRKAVTAGVAMRVMTGSLLPRGADTLVRFEDTNEPENKNGPNPKDPSKVKVFVPSAPGAFVFPAASSAARGEVLVPAGTVIGPGQISALTTIGVNKVKAFRRPVVAILATGDELTTTRGVLPPGKAYNANSAALVELVRRQGGLPRLIGIARDQQADLDRKLLRALAADIILTSGGVSKGDFDLVRLAIAKLGRLVSHRVAMGPGGSFTFGLLRGKRRGSSVPIFALSGPPAGCLINFETLVRPAMRKMMGYSVLQHAEVRAVALDGIVNPKQGEFVRWTQLTETPAGYCVRFNGERGRGFTRTMAMGNSLTILPKSSEIKPGDRVKVLPLDWVL